MISQEERQLRSTTEGAKTGTIERPSRHWRDLWKAPLHDFPIRDEALHQYLRIAPGMDIVEVGPGSGFTAFRLARQARSMMLLEIAAGNVERLHRDLEESRNVSLVCGDACEPGLGERLGRKFDAAFGMALFECVPDRAACLNNFAALLRPGGQLLLQWPNYDVEGKMWSGNSFRKRAEIDQLLKAAGFESWELYSLQLRPYASFVFRTFHELPLRMYRRWRAGRGGGAQKPKDLSYDQTWAFQQRRRIEDFKFVLHAAWAMLGGAIRLGGDCFERTLLEDDVLNRNLLLVARR